MARRHGRHRGRRAAGPTVITMADREADFYDLLAAPRRDGSHLLMRAKPRRRSATSSGCWGGHGAGPAAGTMTVELRRGDDRRRGGRSDDALRDPGGRAPGEPPRPQGVAAPEDRGDPGGGACRRGGQEPVCWWLVTTLEMAGLAEAERAVRWYALRWLIERYHYVLKSGCRIERLQLETAERLDRALATYAVVAWRLLWLTYEARRHPEGSCEPVLPREHWEVLHRVVHKAREVPASPPGLREAVRQIARLGGFLRTKATGSPGSRRSGVGYGDWRTSSQDGDSHLIIPFLEMWVMGRPDGRAGPPRRRRPVPSGGRSWCPQGTRSSRTSPGRSA